MDIKNYHPDEIERDFNTLKEDVKKINQRTKEKYISKIFIISVVLLFTLVSTIISTSYAIVNKDSLSIVGISSFVIVSFSVSFVITLLWLISTCIDGPDTVWIESKQTFSMKFWNTIKDNNLISVKRSQDTCLAVIVTYEDKDHFVHCKVLTVSGVVTTTEVKETMLDVGKGYILEPLGELGKKTKIINE
jgi:hypothetical protein